MNEKKNGESPDSFPGLIYCELQNLVILESLL